MTNRQIDETLSQHLAAVESRVRVLELLLGSGGAGAGGGVFPPSAANYLVGTSDPGLSGEIVVGTVPGGQLGGTWASPSVDTSHSGSTHAGTQAAAEATAASTLATHEADTTSIHGITDTAQLVTLNTVQTITGQKTFQAAAAGTVVAILKGAAAQTGNVLELQNSAAAVLTYFTSIGQLILKAGTDAAIPGGTSGLGTDGSNNLWVRSAGEIELNPSSELRLRKSNVVFVSLAAANFFVNNGVVVPYTFFNQSAIGGLTLVAKAGAGQGTANVQEWQSSAAAVGMAVDSALRLKWFAGAETATATAGAVTLPADAVGFFSVTDSAGNIRKIAYYAA